MVRAGVKFCLLFGLYLLLAGQVSTDEVVAALLCGGAATGISMSIPLIAERHFRFVCIPWLRVFGSPLLSVLQDIPRIAIRLLLPNQPPGTVQRWPFTVSGDDRRSTAQRALVTLGASLAPNSYVIAILSGRGEMLVHRLLPAEPPQDPEWPV